MTLFDPAAATQAYLNQMSPAAQAKAIAYTHGSEWLILGEWVVSMVVAWLLVRSGVLVGLRSWIEQTKPRPFLASLVVGFSYVVLSFVLTLPWTIFSGWWFQKSFGLTSQPLTGFMTDILIQSGFDFVLTTLFIVVIYFVLRRAPKTWWLWATGVTAIGFLIVLVIAPTVIEPLLNTYKPAPPGPTRDAVVALGKQTGTPTDKIYIYNGSKQSNRYTANVSGIGSSARVAMSDVMFKKGADIAQVRGVVGHEMGHYVHQHSLWLLGFLSVLSFVAFWLAGQLFPLFVKLLGARGVKGIADPAGIAVLFAVIATVTTLMTPLNKSLTRIVEADADRFSLEHANEPDGLSQALILTAEYRAPSPSWIEETLFYDHPSVERRIRRAMDWKATHPRAEPVAAPAAAAPASSSRP